MRIPENSFLRTTPIAHRGLHDIKKGIPENSYAAYQAAIDKNYAIEMDVRFSKRRETRRLSRRHARQDNRGERPRHLENEKRTTQTALTGHAAKNSRIRGIPRICRRESAPSHRTEKRTRAKRSRKSDACGIKKLQGRICTAILSAEICVPDEKASPADLTRATRDDPLKRRNHARRTEMGAEKHAIPFFDQTRLYQFQYRKSSFLQSEEKKRFAPRLDGAHRRGISPRQAHDR